MTCNKNNTHGARGVVFKDGRWRARITINGKRKHLGYFNTKEEAYETYRRTAMENKLECRLNPLNNATRKEYYIRSRDKVLKQSKEYYKNNFEKIQLRNRSVAWKIKIEIIEEYGGECTCCKESNPEFLTIHHVYNDGAKHRKELQKNGGSAFYRWLKKEGFPKDRYCLLCCNCNCAYGYFGYCPHQRDKGDICQTN